jgi:transcriptional regulator with XRE-family HTH domain
MAVMTKKQDSLTDQVRQAANKCGRSQHALARATGIDNTALSRFISGKRGLSMEALDALADVLRLRIVADGPIKLPPPLKPGPKPKRKGKVTK